MRTISKNLAIFALVLSFAMPALAATPPSVVTPAAPLQSSGGSVVTPGNSSSRSENRLVNPLRGIDSFEELLARILEAVVDIGTIVLTVAIIWVGFLFVAARGNEEKIKQARQALMYAVIGGLLLLGAQAIASVIQSSVESLSS